MVQSWSESLSNARLAKRESGTNPAAIERAGAGTQPWDDSEWQRLWLAVESRPWRSLALVPAGEGASLEFTVDIAIALSRTATVHLGRSLQIADATQVPLNQLNAFFGEVQRCTSNGERLLLALPPTASAMSVSIAQSVDAAVLCVLLDRMTSADAKRTVKLVGTSRFLGSAIFHPHQPLTKK
jgi:hypothetical protein